MTGRVIARTVVTAYATVLMDDGTEPYLYGDSTGGQHDHATIADVFRYAETYLDRNAEVRKGVQCVRVYVGGQVVETYVWTERKTAGR